MQSVFFTNPYRENDKVTVWFRDNIRDRLKDKPEVFFATVAFRRFNSIPTGEILLANNLHLDWSDWKLALKVIRKETEAVGKPYLSGAYMITGPEGGNKLEFLCKCNQVIYERRHEYVELLEECTTLEQGWRILKRFHNVGPFIAYEWITDLRHTYLFRDATDLDTWCSFGPGALRGIHRLLGLEPVRKMPPQALRLMRELHIISTSILNSAPYKMPKLEMREMEHSLCEFDKYERVRTGGAPKRWYRGY